jgi:hypothetical protein
VVKRVPAKSQALSLVSRIRGQSQPPAAHPYGRTTPGGPGAAQVATGDIVMTTREESNAEMNNSTTSTTPGTGATSNLASSEIVTEEENMFLEQIANQRCVTLQTIPSLAIIINMLL